MSGKKRRSKKESGEEKKRRITDRILRMLNKKGELLQKDLPKTLNASRTLIHTVLKELESKDIIEKEEIKVKGVVCRKIKPKKESMEGVKKDKDKDEVKSKQIIHSDDVLFVLLNKLGFPVNFLEQLKVLGYKLDEVIYSAVRDWAIRNGFSFGDINIVHNIPVVSSEDVMEINREKDKGRDENRDSNSTRVVRKYKVRGFKEEFEDAFSLEYIELDFKRACVFAKTMWDNNRKCVIVKQPRGYKLLVESYNILKDPKIGVLVRA